MKTILFMMTLLITANSGAEVPSFDHSSTLCDQKNEQIIFSCPIVRTNKILSVCRSLPTNKDAYVEYRFGRKHKIELSYQASKRYSDHQIFLNQANLQVGQHYTIYFTNGRTGYRLSLNSSNQNLRKSAALSIYKIDATGYKLEQEGMSFMCDSPVQENIINRLKNIPYLTTQTDGQLNDWAGS
jgi:hypothetical protein